jgi:hypothetical protein
MSPTLYTASVPVFVRTLKALDAILDKAAVFAAAKKIDPKVLCATRLIPDMLPLSRQVLIACDFAKNTAARLAGVEAPKFDDTESTIDELKVRIARTIAVVEAADRAAIEGAPGRDIAFTIGGNAMKMEATAYLEHFALPNFYFHVVTAYAILRSSGLDVGKRDYMGAVTGIGPA